MARVVGLDFGLAKIGVSLSDNSKIIASVLGSMQTKKQLSDTIKELLALLDPYKKEIELIILGNPLHLNGTMSQMAQEVAHFKEQLEKASGYSVLLWDERLSTSQAERALKEANVNRKKRSKVIDGVAASLLLQSYLDSLASNY